MRTFICTILLAASVAGYSQEIMVGLGYDDVIEYLEENGHEWTTDTELAPSGEEVLFITANHYFGVVEYIIYKDSDICWVENRFLHGISKASLIKHLEVKYEQIDNLVWADFSNYGSSDSLLLIHQIIEGEDDQFRWDISPHAADPGTAKGFFTRSMARFRYGFYNEAIKDFSSARRLDKDYPFGDYAEVIKVLIMVGEAEAEDLFDSLALGTDHGSIDYWIQGLEKAYENDLNAAIEAFSNTLDADHDFVVAYYSRGMAYLRIGSLEKANADLTAYIDRFPEAYYAIRQRAYNNADMGNHEMAINDLNLVLTAFPEDIETITEIAKSKSYLGQYNESLELLKKSLRIDPDASDTYVIKGLVYQWMNDGNENDLSNFTRAIALDPENYHAYYLRARTYANTERHIEAIEDFNRAIEINPYSLDSYFSRALSRSETGDRTGAIDDYREMLKYEESLEGNFLWGTVYNNKGHSLIELGRYEEARPLIDKALELEPDEYYIWSSSGHLNYLNGEYESCISDMDMAIHLEATDMSKAPGLGHEVSYFYSGLAKIKLGNLEEGCIDLRQSIEAGNPDAGEEFRKLCK